MPRDSRARAAAPPRRQRGRPPKTPVDPPFPNRIRELREARGLTQQQLADEAQLSKQQISALERGAKQIVPSTGRRIAVALGCALADLFGDGPAGSIPLVLTIASAFSEERPQSFEAPALRRIALGARLERVAECLAAEIADNSADRDYPRHSLLVIRPFAAGEPIPLGQRVVVRFWGQPESPYGPRRTREILYGILERSRSGDLVLATRSRNPEIPRRLVIARAAAKTGFSEPEVGQPASREAGVVEPQPEAQAEILGAVVWQSGPPRG